MSVPAGAAVEPPAATAAPATAAPVAVTAPVAVSAAPAPPLPAPPAPLLARCDNCGASVGGRYCGACGQRLEPPVHSLWHFSQVAFEDLTHADSRLWRTLAALLFKPGFLTREFLAGRRASYLPPVRLYLVLSVVFFIWIAATPGSSPFRGYAGSSSGAAELRQVASELEVEARADPRKAAALAAARRAVAAAEAAGTRPAGVATPAAGEAPPADAGQRCNLEYHGPWQQTLGPALKRGCENAVRDNGRSLKEALVHNLPRAMFLFLPLLAGAMMLFYWRPRRYYVEHLLFFVHNHAFAFLFLMLAWAIAALLPFAVSLVNLVATLYIAWYLYRSMSVVYGQGRARTLLKLSALSFLYLVSGAVMLAITALYSLLML
jgi:uncharacterized protein DUF3667